MSEHNEHDPITPQKAGESGHRYVEQLVESDDYWLSLTDAARITRRQEVTIRRWVAAGTLPVRRQGVGVNQRTRHVRASDLAKLTPIIDPTAAITGAPANADLLSIPVQHATLMAEQEMIRQQLITAKDHTATLFTQFSQLETAQQEAIVAMTKRMVGMRQEIDEEMKQHAQQQKAQMQHLHAEVTTQYHQVQEVIDQERHERHTQIASLETTVTQLRATLSALQQEQAMAVQGLQTMITELATRRQDDFQQQSEALLELQQAYARQHQEVQHLTNILQQVTHEHYMHQQRLEELFLFVTHVQENQIQWQRQQMMQMAVLTARIRRHRLARSPVLPQGQKHHVEPFY